MSGLIEYLEKLQDPGDDKPANRAALAALRQGLGKPPGTVASMYPHVMKFVSPKTSRREEEAYFIVASLFAFHPAPGGSGNLGKSLAMLKEKSSSIEQRFVALLESHREEVVEHLRHAVSLLRSNSIPVDWNELLPHVIHWDHEDRWVQRQWAREFWTPREEDNPEAAKGASQ